MPGDEHAEIVTSAISASVSLVSEVAVGAKTKTMRAILQRKKKARDYWKAPQ
jgi:hypothetical protein